VLRAQGELVYVSALPGDLPLSSDIVTIRNPANGAEDWDAVVEGGFDPVPIAAEVGGTLEITVLGANGTLDVLSAAVPLFRAFGFVRSRPPRGQTAVPLNKVIVIVFNKPLDPLTVTEETVQLLRGPDAVAVERRVREDGVSVELAPLALLEPNTEYTILATTGVADASGSPLETEVSSTFTTGLSTSTIVFARSVRGPQGVWAVNPDGSDLRPIVLNGAVFLDGLAVSPDLQKIAAESGPMFEVPGPPITNIDIVVMDADGRNWVNLTDHPAADARPRWSPDGTRIAFSSDRTGDWEMFVMDADGSGIINLGPGLVEDWSPDGSRILYSDANRGDLWIMNADGSGRLKIVEDAALGRGASWSPDGSRIAFTRTVGPVYCVANPTWGTGPREMDIFVIDVDGSGERNVTDKPGQEWWPSWSPDGTRLVYVEWYATDAFLHVCGSDRLSIINADGTGYAPLTEDGGQLDEWPVWGP
jgi:TolB protein